MALSIAFTVLYMFGIPSYLYYLIKKAVGEVDRNLGTERLYDEIKEVRSKKAEGWEKAAKQLEDDAQKKYQEAVNAYQQAASTLYSSYERKFRYYKIIVLVEKLILIMVGSISFLCAATFCFNTVVFCSFFSGKLAPFERVPYQAFSEYFQSRIARASDSKASDSDRHHRVFDFRACFPPFSRRTRRFYGHHVPHRQHVSSSMLLES